MATSSSKPDWQNLAEWLSRLSSLIESVDKWLSSTGWSTRRIEKKMQDPESCTYQAPALLMQKETTRIILEPIARSAPGAEGVVDLYVLPAYDDIASLYFYEDRWNIHYALPSDPPVSVVEETPSKRLTKKNLNAVLDELTKNAA
jgi:hypothetical protein